MANQHLDCDVFFPVLCKFRPVVCYGFVIIEQSPVDSCIVRQISFLHNMFILRNLSYDSPLPISQEHEAESTGSFGGGEEDAQGIFLPGILDVLVSKASPQVTHQFAFVVHGKRSTTLCTRFQILPASVLYPFTGLTFGKILYKPTVAKQY